MVFSKRKDFVDPFTNAFVHVADGPEHGLWFYAEKLNDKWRMEGEAGFVVDRKYESKVAVSGNLILAERIDCDALRRFVGDQPEPKSTAPDSPTSTKPRLPAKREAIKAISIDLRQFLIKVAQPRSICYRNRFWPERDG